MANFQGLVLMGGIALLIVSIILIIIFLRYSKSAIEWPPVTGSCPDYWVDLSGNGARCVNVHDLGTCPNNNSNNKHLNMDFSAMDECSKFTWVQKCDVWWDGINYGFGKTAPCTSDTTTTE